jgi:hypothetical protein
VLKTARPIIFLAFYKANFPPRYLIYTTSKARSQAKEEEKQTNKQFDQENKKRVEEIKQSFPARNLG